MARTNAINDLIIVIYLPVKDLSQDAIWRIAGDASLTIKKAVPEARIIAIPTNEENGKVECINPKLIDAKEWESVKTKIDTMEKIVNELARTEKDFRNVQK